MRVASYCSDGYVSILLINTKADWTFQVGWVRGFVFVLESRTKSLASATTFGPRSRLRLPTAAHVPHSRPVALRHVLRSTTLSSYVLPFRFPFPHARIPLLPVRSRDILSRSADVARTRLRPLRSPYSARYSDTLHVAHSLRYSFPTRFPVRVYSSHRGLFILHWSPDLERGQWSTHFPLSFTLRKTFFVSDVRRER